MTDPIKAWAIQQPDGTISPRTYATKDVASIMAGSETGGAIGEPVPVVILRAEDYAALLPAHIHPTEDDGA